MSEEKTIEGGIYSAELEEIRRGWQVLASDLDVGPLSFFARIAILTKLHDVFCEGFLEPFGITWAEYQTLGILRSTGKGQIHSPAGLARWARQTRAGMTKTLDRLEQAGLARRRPHPSDRRRIEVVLNDDGATLTDRILRAQLDAQGRLLDTVSAARRREFDGAIRKLLQLFAEDAGKNGDSM